MMLASASPPPPPSSRAAPLPAGEIENTPWFAERIDPTWLPESAANRSAEARAFRVASVIMSDFSAFKPVNSYRIPPCCPFVPPTTIPACTRSAVFCRLRNLVHILRLHRHRLLHDVSRPRVVPAILIRQFVGHFDLPHGDLSRRNPLPRKKLQHRRLIRFTFGKHLRKVISCLFEAHRPGRHVGLHGPLHQPLHRHIPVRQPDVLDLRPQDRST